MISKTLKILRNVAVVLVLCAGALVCTVWLRHDRTFEAPYPELHASADPAVIERGRYLAYGISHCVDCHGDRTKKNTGERDLYIPLIGGHEWHLPLGVVRSKNITPDRETGIGRYSDAELARILRYGVHADGRAVLPFMSYGELADDDLVAVMSFLRAQPPVRSAVPPNELNLLGQTVLAFVIEPQGPKQPPAHTLVPEPSVEYGQYLATTVGNCAKCHTPMDMRTGEFVGPLFSGGNAKQSETDPSQWFTPPNLTPDPKSGHIYGWSEDLFVARLQAGPLHAASPMPWQSLRRITDTDARALYRYLRSLPAAAGGSAGSPDAIARVQ